MDYQHKLTKNIAEEKGCDYMILLDENKNYIGRIKKEYVESTCNWQPLPQYDEGEWLKTYNGSIFRYARAEGDRIIGENFVLEGHKETYVILKTTNYTCKTYNIERKATKDEIQWALKTIATHLGIVEGAYVESVIWSEGKVRDIFVENQDLWVRLHDGWKALMYDGDKNEWGKVLEPPKETKTIYINDQNTGIKVTEGKGIKISLK